MSTMRYPTGRVLAAKRSTTAPTGAVSPTSASAPEPIPSLSPALPTHTLPAVNKNRVFVHKRFLCSPDMNKTHRFVQKWVMNSPKMNKNMLFLQAAVFGRGTARSCRGGRQTGGLSAGAPGMRSSLNAKRPRRPSCWGSARLPAFRCPVCGTSRRPMPSAPSSPKAPSCWFPRSQTLHARLSYVSQRIISSFPTTSSPVSCLEAHGLWPRRMSAMLKYFFGERWRIIKEESLTLGVIYYKT